MTRIELSRIELGRAVSRRRVRTRRAEQVEDAIPKSRRRGEGGGGADEGERGETPTSALAGGAGIDVSSDALADQHGELPVPVGQNRRELLALLPAAARHAIRAEAPLGALAHPMHEPVTLLWRHPEGIGEVVAGQVLAHRQFEHELIARVEPAGGAAEQFGEIVELGRVLHRVGL